jgi:hypothetical protein
VTAGFSPQSIKDNSRKLKGALRWRMELRASIDSPRNSLPIKVIDRIEGIGYKALTIMLVIWSFRLLFFKIMLFKELSLIKAAPFLKERH